MNEGLINSADTSVSLKAILGTTAPPFLIKSSVKLRTVFIACHSKASIL